MSPECIYLTLPLRLLKVNQHPACLFDHLCYKTVLNNNTHILNLGFPLQVPKQEVHCAEGLGHAWPLLCLNKRETKDP